MTKQPACSITVRCKTLHYCPSANSGNHSSSNNEVYLNTGDSNTVTLVLCLVLGVGLIFICFALVAICYRSTHQQYSCGVVVLCPPSASETKSPVLHCEPYSTVQACDPVHSDHRSHPCPTQSTDEENNLTFSFSYFFKLAIIHRIKFHKFCDKYQWIFCVWRLVGLEVVPHRTADWIVWLQLQS